MPGAAEAEVGMLLILVPRTGTSAEALVLPGSAVVSRGNAGCTDRIVCYFEGNRNEASNLNSFRAKQDCAAGRLATRYPTVAMAVFSRDDFIEIGLYDETRYVPTEISDAAALKAWCGESPDDVIGKRLAPGEASWQEAAAAVSDNSRPLGPQRPEKGLWFKTAAGQVLCFDTVAKISMVYNHDDPELPDILFKADVAPAAYRLILGESQKPIG